MHVWSALNRRQLEMLRRINGADGALLTDWADIARTVLALRSRRLVDATRSKEGWTATITDAGRHYLEHGEHPEKPQRAGVRDGRRSQGGSKGRRQQEADEYTVDSLLEALANGGGLVRVDDPDPATRAAWRRVIHAAKETNQVPEGFHIRHQGRDRGDLVIALAEGPHPDTEYRATKTGQGISVETPGEGEPLHPVADGWSRRPGSVSKMALPRATRLVHAFVVAAEGRGHSVRLDEAAPGRLMVEVGGATFELVVEEEKQEVDRIDAPDNEAGEKVYSWQRVRPKRVVEPSGRLSFGFADYDYRFRGRRQRWADRARWTLGDKLPEALAEIEARALVLDEQRRRDEEKRLQRQKAWERAMTQARMRFIEDHRRKRLVDQLDALDEARRARAYCSVLRALVDDEIDQSRQDRLRAWTQWVETYAERRDPTTWPDLVADDPVPTEQDLEQYLDGWSPYGPDDPPSRRHRSW